MVDDSDEGPLPDWLAVDTAPLGPNFVWAVRARSSRPADAAAPWFVILHGVSRTEREGKWRGEQEVRSAIYRMGLALERLCWSSNVGEFPRTHSDKTGAITVGWWRQTDRQEDKSVGLIRVAEVELFWGADMDAWELAKAASTALLGKPLAIFEDETSEAPN